MNINPVEKMIIEIGAIEHVADGLRKGYIRQLIKRCKALLKDSIWSEYQSEYEMAQTRAGDVIWQSIKRSRDSAPDWEVHEDQRPGAHYWKRGDEYCPFSVTDEFLGVDPKKLWEKMQAKEQERRAQKIKELGPGVCVECDGEGEQGGQFCGGYWACETCNGTGKAMP